MTLQPRSSGAPSPRSWPERVASYVVMVLWLSAGIAVSKLITDSDWKYLIGIALMFLLFPAACWVEQRVLTVVRARFA